MIYLIDLMVKRILAFIKKYSIDGLMIHSNGSCKPYSAGEYDIQKLVIEKPGRLSLVIEVDMTDARCCSDAQMQTHIEAFKDTLGNKKFSTRRAKDP